MDPELEEPQEDETGDGMPTNGAEYVLTDMVLSSVGLVPRGANMQKFFLLKNQKEADMPEDIVIEEVPDEETKGLLHKIWERVESLGKADPPPDPEPDGEPEPEPASAPPAAEPPAAEGVGGDALEKVLKAQVDRFEALLKAQKAEFSAKLDKMEADLEKANERAEAAEQYATGQTEQAERQASIQKALSFKAVPLASDELGDMLYKLEKSLPADQFEKVEATLRAMDKQAWTAGLFNEVGTARTPQEANLEAKLAKVAKEQDISLADALLTLPVEEQLALQKQWDEEG